MSATTTITIKLDESGNVLSTTTKTTTRPIPGTEAPRDPQALGEWMTARVAPDADSVVQSTALHQDYLSWVRGRDGAQVTSARMGRYLSRHLAKTMRRGLVFYRCRLRDAGEP